MNFLTREDVETWRKSRLGSNCSPLLDEIERFWKREKVLLESSTASMEKARRWESEANQEYAERLLVRNECIRLRETLCVLASHIEMLYANGGEIIPDDVRAAIEAVFPPDATKGDPE